MTSQTKHIHKMTKDEKEKRGLSCRYCPTGIGDYIIQSGKIMYCVCEKHYKEKLCQSAKNSTT